MNLLFNYIKNNEYENVVQYFKENKNININKIIINSDDEKIFEHNIFMYACAYSSLKIVKFLMKNGADIDSKNTYKNVNFTPLSCSCFNKDIDIMKFLLKNKCNVNFIDFDHDSKTTALHTATIQNVENYVKLLLDNGADVHLKNWEDLTADEIISSGNKKINKNIIELLKKYKKFTYKVIYMDV